MEQRSPGNSGTHGPADVTADELATQLASMLEEALLAFDVDGVLAPIVEHADDARLSPGVSEALARLVGRTTVAILSGRSLADLERLFGFPAGAHVIGSHGLERRGDGGVVLDAEERARFDQLERLGRETVERAGDGAWLEYKPASVVVHTRRAEPTAAEPALAALPELVDRIDGAQMKPGHHVVELLARSASKGTALLELAGELGRSPIVFLGDDVTDEDAFALMGDTDVSVRVGTGESVARFRLGGPDDVVTLLDELSRIR